MNNLKKISLWIKEKKTIIKKLLQLDKINVIKKKHDKEVILFISHVFSDLTIDRFLKLRKLTANNFDVFALIDANHKFSLELWNKELRENNCSDSLIPFYPNELEEILGYKYFIKNSIIPGCAHYPLLFFWKQFEYVNYWVVEYDVEFSGNWSDFFNHFKNNHEDLLASHLTRFHLNPTWQWWGSLHPPRSLSKAMKAKQADLPKGFFPLYRISERALRVVDTAHRQKWRGHFEVLLPTVLEENGLAAGDFNSYGTFYTNGSIEPNDGTSPHSSLRWRPEIDPQEFKRISTPCIFHPVK